MRVWRWLRWTFRCRRGRRCARLEIAALELDAPPPPGPLTFQLSWRCSGCGTTYTSTETMFG